MGQGEPGLARGEYSTQGQILHGGGPICLVIWEQIMEPDKGRNSVTGGLQYSRRILDGSSEQASKGIAPYVGIPTLKGHAQ